MTEDEIKAEMNVYNKIIADNYALYCETPKDNGRTDTLIKTIEELERTKKLYARAKWWLNEIINNHRFTPISTAEVAVKDLNEKEQTKL